MQIVIDIAQPGDQALAGTAWRADSASERRRFTGVMELIACLEQLCAAGSQHNRPSEAEEK